MAIGTDNAIARFLRLHLDAIEHRREEVGHQIGHNDTNHLGCFLAPALCKGVGPIVQLLGQSPDTLLHLQAYLGLSIQRTAHRSNADSQPFGHFFH